MIFFDLIRQQGLQAVRARGFYKNMIANIFIGLTFLYLAACFVMLGFFLGRMLHEAMPDKNLNTIFSGAMIYVIILGLTIRYIIQQLGVLNLRTYQTLPIKRSSLVNYLLLKPLFNPLNYVALLLVIPFAFVSIMPISGVGGALQAIFVFIEIIWFDTLMAALLKRKFGGSIISIICVVAFLVGIFALEYFKVFSFFDFSVNIFSFTLTNVLGWLIPLAFVVAAYLLNRLFFARNYYIEDKNEKSQTAVGGNISFLNRFGVIGEIMSLQLKLILRNKRTKKMLYMSFILLFYGFIFYHNPSFKSDIYFVVYFAAVIVTGMTMAVYGQYAFCLEGSYFDGLMSNNIKTRDYLTAILRFMQCLNVLCFVLTTPYFILGKMIIINHIAAFLFNTGFIAYMLLFSATYNTKKMDLKSNSVFNQQGFSLKNFLIMIPMMILPMIIIGVMNIFFDSYVALIVLSVIGVLGLLLDKKLIEICVRQFNKRKYAMCDGFRENE